MAEAEPGIEFTDCKITDGLTDTGQYVTLMENPSVPDC
jgi:hypothetical protein